MKRWRANLILTLVCISVMLVSCNSGRYYFNKRVGGTNSEILTPITGQVTNSSKTGNKCICSDTIKNTVEYNHLKEYQENNIQDRINQEEIVFSEKELPQSEIRITEYTGKENHISEPIVRLQQKEIDEDVGFWLAIASVILMVGILVFLVLAKPVGATFIFLIIALLLLLALVIVLTKNDGIAELFYNILDGLPNN